MWRIDRGAESTRWKWAITVLLISSLAPSAQISPSSLLPTNSTNPQPQTMTFSQAVDRTIAKEHQLLELMANLSPLVETYIQIMRPDRQLGMVPVKDEYFLGRLGAEHDVQTTSYLGQRALLSRFRPMLNLRHQTRFSAQGFTRMIFPDQEGFDRVHYDFRYAGREVLGKVRCSRVDVLPKAGSGQGRFLGRIWVEDQDYSIVRFNGALKNDPQFQNSVHFDSWRLNFFPRVWLPVYIYTEEPGSHTVLVKAQTRLWAYDLQHAGDHHEFAERLADVVIAGDHIDSGVELSPILSERSFQYSGEEEVIERLQVAGLVAPDGEVDRVLENIVKDLMLSNDTDGLYNVRCRVLLTLPLDSFSVGQTIFISRGLLDVVPDEATLALLLAHELGHITLGHAVAAENAFSDDVLLSNDGVLARLSRFHCDQAAERRADEKALQLLANSQYREKLRRAVRFLKKLNTRSLQLPNLVSPHLRRASQDLLLAPMTQSASRVNVQSQDPAALPLGSRIKLNPWNNRVTLIQPTTVPLLPVEEVMSLQLTPFHPYLSRSCLGDAVSAIHQQ